MKLFLLIITVVLSASATLAQRISNLESALLPVSQLVDSAEMNSASVRYFVEKKASAQQSVTVEKRSWSQYISAEAAYSMGIFDNISLDQSGQNDAVTLSSAGQQTRYYVGARISVPLSAAYARNPKIQIAKIEVLKADAEAESQRQQLRHKILELYSDLLVTARVLEIKIMNFETTSIQLTKAESDFSQGKIEVSGLAAFREIYTKAKVDIEHTQADLELKMSILEDICGCSLYRTDR